jgi:[acyl-carrier-protein] S-malonyltransferase
MGEDLFGVRPDLLGSSADEILGFSLQDICLNGPEEELTRTNHAQPALFALSFALWDELHKASGLRPSGAAGHSLGEYTALAAAGAIPFDQALSAVASRGRAMAEAAALDSSGMAALLGAELEAAQEVCERRVADGGRLQVANINAPGQVVLAGGADDISWLVENARDLGVRRAIPLKVAGAFHSSFMEPAASRVAETLSGITVGSMAFPVWANTTAQPHEVDQVKEILARQVVEPVQFAGSLQNMGATGIDIFIHVGPGDVTAGLAKRSVDGATVMSVSSIDDIPAVAEAIGTIAGTRGVL